MMVRLLRSRRLILLVSGAVLLAILPLTFSRHAASADFSANIPEAPRSAPSVVAEQGYLNRTFLTIHTTEPFDSTGGNLLVVCASSHAGVLMTPSDSFHNTWIPGAGPTNTASGFNLRTQIWYAKSPVVGDHHTFTLTLSQPQSLVISLFVVKGADRSAPIDAVSPIGDDAGSQLMNVNSPAIKTTSANDLLIGFGKSSIHEVWIPGEGYLVQYRASSDFLASEMKWGLKPGSYSSAFNISSPGTWQTALVAVRPASPTTRGQTVSKSSNRQSAKLHHSEKHSKPGEAL